MPSWRTGVGPPPAVISLKFLASASGVGATLALPATIQAGDVAWVSVFSSKDVAPAAPAGWRLLGSHNTAGVNRTLYSCKILVAGEPAIPLTAGSTSEVKGVMVYRPDVPANQIIPGGLKFAARTNANPPAQTVVAAAASPPLIVFAGWFLNSAFAIDRRIMSPAKDREVMMSPSATNNPHWLADKIFNSSPANVVVDMDDEGSNHFLASGYLRVV